jgi:hypothetical protein
VAALVSSISHLDAEADEEAFAGGDEGILVFAEEQGVTGVQVG